MPCAVKAQTCFVASEGPRLLQDRKQAWHFRSIPVTIMSRHQLPQCHNSMPHLEVMRYVAKTVLDKITPSLFYRKIFKVSYLNTIYHTSIQFCPTKIEFQS